MRRNDTARHRPPDRQDTTHKQHNAATHDLLLQALQVLPVARQVRLQCRQLLAPLQQLPRRALPVPLLGRGVVGDRSVGKRVRVALAACHCMFRRTSTPTHISKHNAHPHPHPHIQARTRTSFARLEVAAACAVCTSSRLSTAPPPPCVACISATSAAKEASPENRAAIPFTFCCLYTAHRMRGCTFGTRKSRSCPPTQSRPQQQHSNHLRPSPYPCTIT